MQIDVLADDAMTLTQACKVLPRRNGKRPSPTTLWRWCDRGIKGIRLGHIRYGRTIMTSRPALQRFFEALAEVDSARREAVQFREMPKPIARQAPSRSDTQRILASVGLAEPEVQRQAQESM